jgi:hypothetical protein
MEGSLGVVESIVPGGVVVKLDSEPATTFRMNPMGGFAKPSWDIVRFFQFNEIKTA